MNRISSLFAVFDRAAEAFMPPFLAPHTGVATRGFVDAIQQSTKDSDISKHPDDFDLFEVGTFDASSGVVSPLSEGNKLILQGKQVALRYSEA